MSNRGTMNTYHQEQIDALSMVRHLLKKLPQREQKQLRASVADYIQFRQEVDSFLARYFNDVCTATCYQSRTSACCSREGIITFFADIVVNLLASEQAEFERLLHVLGKPNEGSKCVYLSETGCLWHLKPIVCQMFLCDRSKKQVFDQNPRLRNEWEFLETRRKGFTWPDRPVLFDDLESYFLKAGCRSPLMYLHNSPGLLRIKQKAGYEKKRQKG